MKNPEKHRSYMRKWIGSEDNKRKHREYNKGYRSRDGFVGKKRAYVLKHRYGLDAVQVENILRRQKWSCAICLDSAKAKLKNLCVDHCHKTGKVRGLLCIRCNSSIGMARDSTRILKRAIKYLEFHRK